MPIIRVSDELYSQLEKLAVGFDTPANVISRVIEERNIKKKPSNDLLRPSHVPTKKKKAVQTITSEMVRAVCTLGEKVAKNEISSVQAKDNLISLGMNSSSAHMYLYAFQAMLNGSVFKRGMKVNDVKYLLDFIRQKYGFEAFRLAVHSFEQHVDYLLSQGYHNPGRSELLEEMQAKLLRFEVYPFNSSNPLDRI